MHNWLESGLLRCKGKEIVDQWGNPFLLRGFGLGGWLVPEGYMLHSVAASPTMIRLAITDLVGKKETAEFFKLYEENYVNEDDIKALASFGVNSIRLPFSYKMLSVKRGEYLEAGFQLFDKVIGWCKKYHLYVILDMHCAPGSQNGQNISDGDIDKEAKLFTKPGHYQPWTIEIWQEIARRYVNEDAIAGYDLINEPVLPEEITMQDLRKFYIDLTKGVREYDQRHIVFIEGNWYATNFDELSPKWEDNMAYSFHKYWNETNVASIQERALDLREHSDAPLWMGESGENTNAWFYETIHLLESHQIGWNWWTHKKVANLTNPYSAKIGKDYQRILDFWHQKGPRPTKLQAKRGFWELLENLKLANCDFFQDVVAAVCDKSGLYTSKPFDDTPLPRIIPCAEYDVGTNDVAYHVAKAKRVDFNARNVFNSGRCFRNDAIHIFPSTSKNNERYDVALFEEDSWLKYSVTSKQSETMSLFLTYKGKGKIKVRVNEMEQGYALSSASYSEIHLGDFAVNEGVNTMYITTIKSGLFINKIEFRKVGSH